MVQTNLRESDMEDINAKKYAQDLADFGATVVMLNAAGIIASYDTKLSCQTKSSCLHGDSLGDILKACHEQGIRVIARTDFSKVRMELYNEHPDWAYRTRDNEIVSYNGDVHVCPNSPYQQKYMFDILKEVLTEYPFDGVFCNMSGFLVTDYSGKYYGPCHCEHCRRKFKEQTGLDIPERDLPGDPVYMRYTAFKNRCMADHKKKIYETIKAINPEIAVNGFDYIRSESNTDIGRQPWMYSASSNSRMTSGVSKNRPADNACVDFIGFRYRDISVSPALVELRHWQNLANSGCLSLYVMGRLDNHRDVSSFGPTRKVFAFHAAHEDIFAHITSAAKTVLVHGLPRSYPDPEAQGWIRILTESHIPFDEVLASELSEEGLEGKSLLILGEIKHLSGKAVRLIDDFAANGGTVLADGETGVLTDTFQQLQTPALKCLGITQYRTAYHDRMSSMFEITDADAKYFPRCKDNPYIMPGADLTLVQTRDDTKHFLRLIGEHPFGPPERCIYTEDDITEDAGAFVTTFGRGKGIYIPWKCGTVYRNLGYQNTLSFVQDILFELSDIRPITSNLTPMTEMTLCRTGRQLLLQLVNTSGVFGNSYFEPVPVRHICLNIPKIYFEATKIQTVRALNGGKVQLQSEKDPDNICITLDELKWYEAILIE